MSNVNDAGHRLRLADATSGDHLDAAQEGVINALAGIGYALLEVAAAVRALEERRVS